MARSLFRVMPTASITRFAAVACFAARETAQAGAGVDEIVAGHPLVECILLRAQADAAIQRRVVPDLLAQNADAALARPKLAGRQLQQRDSCRRRSGPSRPVTPGMICSGKLVDADDVAVPLGNFVEGNDRRHFRRSSDLTAKFKMHADSPNKATSTAADQYQGYCQPP